MNIDFENIFDCKSINQSSLNLYQKNLIRLNNNKVPKNLNFLNDINKIQSKLEKYKPNTKRNYIISIVSILSCLKQSNSNKKVNELYNKYYQILYTMNTELKSSNNKTDNEKSNWINNYDIISIYNNLKNDINKIKSLENKKDYDKYLSYVILSLYYLIPPRRNGDYINMIIEKPKKSEFNYFDIDDKKFVFNNYKTNKTYKQQSIDIPHELYDILIDFINLKNELEYSGSFDSNKFLLTDYLGNRFSKSNQITRILNKIFGKNIGSSMLRKVYHTNKYGKIINELEQDAVNMSHSVETILNNYIKK
jgi:hypothetical protein